MSLPVEAVPFPLRLDESGVARVGDSRVPLDIIVREHCNGVDPESIVRAYPTLQLSAVYAAIAYYLLNRGEVDAYIEARRAAAEQLRAEIESKQEATGGFWQRLRDRKAQMEQSHASAGG